MAGHFRGQVSYTRFPANVLDRCVPQAFVPTAESIRKSITPPGYNMGRGIGVSFRVGGLLAIGITRVATASAIALFWSL